MSKRKLKTKTTPKTRTARSAKSRRSQASFKPTSIGMRFKKPILVGVALALFGGPASWMLVNAQSANDPIGVADSAHVAGLDQSKHQGASQSQSTGGGSNAQDKNGKTATAKKSSDANKTTKDNKNTKDTKKAAPSAAAKSSPVPAPAPPVPPKPAPAPTPPPAPYTGVHDNIKTTIFWVGEPADADNANITNTVSAWDEAWQAHYGGVDDPNSRNGYFPAAFTPLENPFYFALPYNDFDDSGHHKASASNCPNAAALASRRNESWCKNSWIKITHGGKTTYAQWQDVGPLQEDDTAYVFGTARPKNTWGARAGLDVSPAVRDYLGLQDVDTVSWSFISASSVPAGPWKQVVTTSGVYWL